MRRRLVLPKNYCNRYQRQLMVTTEDVVARGGGGGMGVNGIAAEELTTLGVRSLTSVAGAEMTSAPRGASTADDVSAAEVPTGTEAFSVDAVDAPLRTAVFDGWFDGFAREVVADLGGLLFLFDVIPLSGACGSKLPACADAGACGVAATQ